MSRGETIGENDQGLRMVVYYAAERFINLDGRTCLVGAQCQLQLVRGFLALFVLACLISVFRVVKDRHTG
jgi:hypothetical protein